jgi:DinB family protein
MLPSTRLLSRRTAAAFSILVFALALHAQTAQNTLTTTGTQRYFNGIRKNLEAAADVMPAEKYSFRLTDGQMTFAEWLNHSTERNYLDCATLKGETAPAAAKPSPAWKEKADVTKALKDSFAYCAAALETIDDAKLLSSPPMTYSFLHILVHNNEIYGNIAGYLRANGIVPPSTAARLSQTKK